MSKLETSRLVALELLDRFCRHKLPGALNRVAAWKGLPNRSLQQWRDDIHQELALDCLLHTQEILQLDERQRHSRWMRAAERTIYRCRRREHSFDSVTAEPSCPAGYSARWPVIQLPELVTMANGRANLVASRREHGQGRRKLRRELEEIATELGWDEEREQFWLARTAEALTGLAADLLRQRPERHLLDVARHCPDPDRHLPRLRRLWRHFPIRPSTLPARRALRPWVRGQPVGLACPRQLLEQAVELQPQSTASWLWLFEACCDDGDHAAAARALRRSRECAHIDRVACLLARAHLLERRGRLSAGMQLMRRAVRRWPGEWVLLKTLAACQDRQQTRDP